MNINVEYGTPIRERIPKRACFAALLPFFPIVSPHAEFGESEVLLLLPGISLRAGHHGKIEMSHVLSYP